MKNIYSDYLLFAKDRNVNEHMVEEYSSIAKPSMGFINPSIVEERKMNFQVMDVFSKLIQERQIFIGSEINSDVANVICSQILYLQTLSDDDIIMYINSPGGSVIDGLAIYDVMNWSRCDIVTTVMGMAASMGAVLLSSGTKGKRKALPNSSIMIHQPLIGGSGIKGQATDILIEAKEMEKCREKLYKILADNAGKTYEEIAKDSERNFWLTADEAKSYGLIDDVIRKK